MTALEIDEQLNGRFGQTKGSTVKFVIASLPLLVVILYFIYEAWKRPSEPFYSIPKWTNDDYVIRQAAADTDSLIPLMDMCIVTLSFCVFWACLTCYTLGYLRLRERLIGKFLSDGRSVLGNVVYERKGWTFGFRYYGYVSYTHPDNNQLVVRKKNRIWEPYTRELVPILVLPGHPMSGQGKEDVEYAHLLCMRNRAREMFLGYFCLAWTIFCALVPLYFLKQMAIIDEVESYHNITDNYDNIDRGWKVYWLFLTVGILGVAMGGTAISWFVRRRWMLKQGKVSDGGLSMHGMKGAAAAKAKPVEVDPEAEYQRMQYS